jgi:hypothetical protein
LALANSAFSFLAAIPKDGVDAASPKGSGAALPALRSRRGKSIFEEVEKRGAVAVVTGQPRVIFEFRYERRPWLIKISTLTAF